MIFRNPKFLGALCALAPLLLTSCTPPGKPNPANNAQAENRESIMDFGTLYGSNCSGCHGDNGVHGPARILNDALYLSILPKETLKQVVINGRPGTAMPAWAKEKGGPLTPQQVDALVDGIYKNWAHGEQAPQGAPAYASTAQGDAAHGKQLFQRDCFMCHGKGAPVGPITDPSYLELSSNQLLRTSIIIGRPDLGMPDYRHLNMGKPLSDQDVTDLVAYVSSKRPGAPPGETGGMGGQEGTPSHVNESGSGNNGPTAKGDEGSGNGPGSPRQQKNEGIKGKGSSSQRGVK